VAAISGGLGIIAGAAKLKLLASMKTTKSSESALDRGGLFLDDVAIEKDDIKNPSRFKVC